MKEKLIAFHLFNLSQDFSIFLHFQYEVEVDCKYVVKSNESSFSADMLTKCLCCNCASKHCLASSASKVTTISNPPSVNRKWSQVEENVFA